MNILNGFLVNEEVLGMLFSMLMGILVGGIIAIGYFIANNGKKFSKNFVITILILPVIMAITIPFIATDLKKTLSLAGIFALVRFRSMPGDSKDILYLFTFIQFSRYSFLNLFIKVQKLTFNLFVKG